MKRRKKNFYGNPFLFILPGGLLFAVFAIYPILSAIPTSFTSWSGLGDKTFVGFGNYITLFTHPATSKDFFNSLLHNMEYLAMGILIGIPLNVFLGYVFYRKIRFGKLIETVLFLPYFFNFLTVGFIVTLFFDPSIGLYSNFMSLIGLPQYSTPGIYSNVNLSVWLAYLVNIWKNIGYFTLLCIANFKMVPIELEEAAYIDGANEWQSFRHVLLPSIRPSIINIAVLTYIWSMGMFDLPFVLGGVNGGVAKNMDFLGVMFYRVAFGESFENSMGMGSAIAVVIFLIVLVGALLQMKILKNGKKAEDDWS